MAFDDVREYISALEKQGELIRINQEMDWDLETSKPSRQKLANLGLEWVLKDIY